MLFFFRISLFIFQGLDFIHNSSLKFHGNLKPSTCLVDSRLQIKLSGFGLWEFKYGEKPKLDLMENPNYEGNWILNPTVWYYSGIILPHHKE